jgi:protein-S-isoprenylcysteine O-methyltransferase Ste14
VTQLFALAISVSVIALVYARWEYRQRGKLSLIGLLLLCAMLFVPNLMLHYVFSYDMPDNPLDYVGVVVGTVGTVLCLVSIIFFRSPLKMLCLVPGELTLTGPYKWSRNPQYVGYLLFLLGFALNDWSGWSLVALVVVTVSLHVLVLIEEEHLRRTFGEAYAEFCRSVPRYARLRYG